MRRHRSGDVEQSRSECVWFFFDCGKQETDDILSGESGASTSRREYQRLHEHVAEYDVVVAHELDRLGRSFADLPGSLRISDIGLVNQPIGTVGEDDWMAEILLNLMVFSDAERNFRLGKE